MDASPEADAGEPAARHGQYGEHGEYAELHCLSNFSFLRGASHPAELISRAQALGYRALALTDECSMAGVVRAHVRAKEAGLQLIIGAEFTFTCGLKLVALAATRLGYGRICQLITRGRRAARKGSYRLAREDLLDCIPPGDDCLLLWHPSEDAEEHGRWLAAHYAGTLWLAVSLLRSGQDAVLLRAALDLAARLSLNCVACGDVHMHEAARRPLQDVLTAIRHRLPLKQAGRRLFPNGERHLRGRDELARLYPPALLAESIAIAARCRFS
ncbi:MAG TPA: PHP domain-containing protein, partial [Steroidobacteraceae bacterium]|nr:PHP domain-containing protein [Steroidobacteraceae bacterium]